jgi:chaperonin GroES
MRELQPLNDHVLLDLSEESKEQKTSGGIIIPDTAKETPQYAKVVAVGEY